MDMTFHNCLSVTQSKPERQTHADGSTYYVSSLQIKFERFGMKLRFKIHLFSQDDKSSQVKVRVDNKETDTVNSESNRVAFNK